MFQMHTSNILERHIFLKTHPSVVTSYFLSGALLKYKKPFSSLNTVECKQNAITILHLKYIENKTDLSYKISVSFKMYQGNCEK